MNAELGIWSFIFTYTIMLLIGIWINLTKKPINPIIAKPIAVAIAIFWNSAKTERKFSLGSPAYGIQEKFTRDVH